jgi:hypothetical protein
MYILHKIILIILFVYLFILVINYAALQCYVKTAEGYRIYFEQENSLTSLRHLTLQLPSDVM